MHAIETMMYAGETPWHGLGAKVPSNVSWREAIAVAGLDWEVAKGFTRAIAESLVSTFPDRFTAVMSKSKRKGKIFVDYLRNGEGATAIAAYSLRARAKAPVSTPIAWSELDSDVRFDHFNLSTVLARLKAMKKDPWADFFSTRQSVTKAMFARVGL